MRKIGTAKNILKLNPTKNRTIQLKIDMRFIFFLLSSSIYFVTYSQEVITIKPNGDTVKYSDMDLRAHLDEHIDGKRLYFYNKKMVSLVEIKNGVMHGYSIQFYPNGKTKSIGSFVKGEKKGKWLYFDEKGRYLKEENR